ncbi:hypothetical protein AMCSP09_000306 [Streptococcus pneumoniae 2081074]|nr:hypothetical protein AMCSP09_000306 [Streptococcus pneumoniae 2081074]
MFSAIFIQKLISNITNKKKNILTSKGKFCYNNRRYFLLLVSQECTGTC